MPGKGRVAKLVNDAIVADARIVAEERLEALSALGKALGKPPPEVRKALKAAGVSTKSLQAGDVDHAAVLMAVMEALGEETVAAAQAEVAGLSDPASVLGATCHGPRVLREHSS